MTHLQSYPVLSCFSILCFNDKSDCVDAVQVPFPNIVGILRETGGPGCQIAEGAADAAPFHFSCNPGIFAPLEFGYRLRFFILTSASWPCRRRESPVGFGWSHSSKPYVFCYAILRADAPKKRPRSFASPLAGSPANRE